MIGHHVVEIDHVNWRGERGVRCIVPLTLHFGTSLWHQDPQWLLHAEDLAKQERRDFAMRDIKSWKPANEKPVEENQWLAHCRHCQSCHRHGQCMYGCSLKGHPKLSAWIAEEGRKRMMLP
jgi:hypothetical protein